MTGIEGTHDLGDMIGRVMDTVPYAERLNRARAFTHRLGTHTPNLFALDTAQMRTLRRQAGDLHSALTAEQYQALPQEEATIKQIVADLAKSPFVKDGGKAILEAYKAKNPQMVEKIRDTLLDWYVSTRRYLLQNPIKGTLIATAALGVKLAFALLVWESLKRAVCDMVGLHHHHHHHHDGSQQQGVAVPVMGYPIAPPYNAVGIPSAVPTRMG